MDKLINKKALILASSLALVTTLFIGCFANAPLNMDESFSGKYWYYINRGYPQAWAGVSLAKTQVDFPTVKMPLLSAEDDRGTKLSKIINLNLVWPVFLKALLISYIPSFIIAKAGEENKKLVPYLKMFNILVITIGVFIYFGWFSVI